jgi:hypothetical protein
MRPGKLSLALAAGLLLASLAGCKEGATADMIAKVQAGMKAYCGFVPTIDMAAAVIDSLASTGGAATLIATASKTGCALVAQKDGQKNTLLGMFDRKDGVEVEGCWASDPRCQPDGTLGE